MGSFRWENVEQFIGLVNLLSLRNGGQAGPKIGKDDEDVDVGDDGDTEHLQTLCSGEDELKQRFLDRLAEAMSRDKGGKHVTCVALQQLAGGGVVLLVTRNEAFKNVDHKFCSTLQRLLMDISSAITSMKSKSHILELEDVLWQELLRYNEPRHEHYVYSFQESLRAFKATRSYIKIPPYCGETEFCDNVDIGRYSEVTHDAYMKFAKAQIAELDDILRAGDRPMQRRLLAEKAYLMRQMVSVKIFINSCSKASLSRQLLSDILFLGRLRSCYFTVLEAAKNIEGFANTSILLVSHPPPRIAPSILPTLAEALKCVGLSLNPSSVQNLISPRLTVTSAAEKFKELQRNSCGKGLHTHAELQLVLHLAQTTALERWNHEIFPYVGSSKLSCFLCYIFFQSFESDGFSFRTRGCHGKLYTLWSIPDTEGLQSGVDIDFYSALKKMRNRLAREMLKPVTPTAQVAESSAAVTVTNIHATQSHHVQKYQMEIAAQRDFDTLRSLWAMITSSDSGHEASEEMNTQSASRENQIAKMPNVYGKCESCDEETSRKCSRCSGPWLCSEACENDFNSSYLDFNCSVGRPLDTADYLCKACWGDEVPEDEQTLEDFSFSKFPSRHDRSRLLGLYIGLCYIDVSHRELHR